MLTSVCRQYRCVASIGVRSIIKGLLLNIFNIARCRCVVAIKCGKGVPVESKKSCSRGVKDQCVPVSWRCCVVVPALREWPSYHQHHGAPWCHGADTMVLRCWHWDVTVLTPGVAVLTPLCHGTDNPAGVSVLTPLFQVLTEYPCVA